MIRPTLRVKQFNFYTEPAMETPAARELRPRPARRYIELARQTCVIDPDRIAIRPSPAALVPPLLGMLVGLGSFGLIVADVVFWRGALPLAALTILLLLALICVPLSSMGLVYGAIGSNVLVDATKQSVTWQQGLLGLGVGTRELVPFWKIDAIIVDESGAAEGRSTEEFAQWQIALLKKSGDRLTIGRVSAPRSLAGASLSRAIEAATAIALLTGVPVHAPSADATGGPVTGTPA